MMTLKTKGFTLIELMIVIAIVGIIAGIAYPSYSDSIKKARRSDAKTAILKLSLAQAKYRGQNSSYSNVIADLNGSTTSENGYYGLSIPSSNGNSYTIKAKAQGAQLSDLDCLEMIYTVSAGNSSGVKTPAACW